MLEGTQAPLPCGVCGLSQGILRVFRICPGLLGCAAFAHLYSGGPPYNIRVKSVDL